MSLRKILLTSIGALDLTATKRIVVDCSYMDKKKRCILDMRETEIPLVAFLNNSALKTRYGAKDADGVSILFY